MNYLICFCLILALALVILCQYYYDQSKELRRVRRDAAKLLENYKIARVGLEGVRAKLRKTIPAPRHCNKCGRFTGKNGHLCKYPRFDPDQEIQ